MSPFAFYLLTHATPVTWVFVAAFLAACVVIYVLLGINEVQAADVREKAAENVRLAADNGQWQADYESVVQDNLELGTELQALLNPELALAVDPEAAVAELMADLETFGGESA